MLRPKPSLLGAVLALAVLAPATASAAVPDHVADEVLVRYRASAHETSVRVRPRDGEAVTAAAARLRRDPHVAYAVPDYVAHASGFTPDDPGFKLQWNLWDRFGIDMPDAW